MADGTLSIEQRGQHLGRVVGMLVGQGGRVETAAEDHAVLAFGGNGIKPWMHAVHGLLTFATIGVWVIVWVVHWTRARNWRRLVAIDEAGRITGSEWKAGRGGALPVIGRVVSREGRVTFPAGQRTVSFSPGLSAHMLTRIVPLLLTSAGADRHITLVNNQWKIATISISLNAPAEQAAVLYWFALN